MNISIRNVILFTWTRFLLARILWTYKNFLYFNKKKNCIIISKRTEFQRILLKSFKSLRLKNNLLLLFHSFPILFIVFEEKYFDLPTRLRISIYENENIYIECVLHTYRIHWIKLNLIAFHPFKLSLLNWIHITD